MTVKRTAAVIAAATLGLVLVWMQASPQAQGQGNGLPALQARVQALEGAVADLGETLEALGAQSGALDAALQAHIADVSAITAFQQLLDQFNQDLSAAETKIALLEAKVADLEQALADLSAPRTYTYYIEESEWRLRQTASAEIGCCSGNGGASVTSGDDFGGGLWASAHLPVGATITDITYYFFDAEPSHRLHFDVLVSTGSAYGLLGGGADTNTSSGWGTVSLGGLPVVYNGGALAFRALPQDNGGTSQSWPAGFNLAVKTVAITYTIAP